MKKITAITLCLMMLAGVMTACGAHSAKGDKLSIVTTIFPEYDWVMQILGDKAESADVAMLLDNGVDLHSYQPTADDIIRISTCDMFIYVGGESDKWVGDALKEAANKDMAVLNLLETLGDKAKEEELIEGMQGVEEEGEEGEEEKGPEYDEHVWLSLRNAAELCSCISSKLCEIDPDNKDAYKANTDAYVAKLKALDNKYKDAVAAAETKTLLFGDRFPFRYLADDYGIDYYAAFAGCSAETEASFETIMFLANKVDELGLKAILQIESADGKIAKTIKDTTKTKNQMILVMNSMQSATSADVKQGASYLSIMEKNLEVLKDALK